MIPKELMLGDRKSESTKLSAEPPSANGKSVVASLVRITLSLTPGIPAGDQLPPEDQSMSPAWPFHSFCAAVAQEPMAMRTPTKSAADMRCCNWLATLARVGRRESGIVMRGGLVFMVLRLRSLSVSHFGY